MGQYCRGWVNPGELVKKGENEFGSVHLFALSICALNKGPLPSGLDEMTTITSPRTLSVCNQGPMDNIEVLYINYLSHEVCDVVYFIPENNPTISEFTVHHHFWHTVKLWFLHLQVLLIYHSYIVVVVLWYFILEWKKKNIKMLLSKLYSHICPYAEILEKADSYVQLGCLKLIVFFASTPSYNFQDFGEKKAHTHLPSKSCDFIECSKGLCCDFALAHRILNFFLCKTHNQF